jgi:hypothetical protein
MPNIAISYRRADSSAIAGRIFDRLVAQYGMEAVFMDIDNVPFGVDFRKHIQDTLRQIQVLIVIVGPNWSGALGTRTARIQNETDPVRVEVETALERGIPLVPVLVDGAKMPSETEVPKSLNDFAFLNAAEVATGRNFHTDMDRLIGAIDGILVANPNSPTSDSLAWKSRTSTSDSARTETAALESEVKSPAGWSSYVMRYFVLPVLVLVIAHHLIINSFDLSTVYLRIAAIVIPLFFGFLLFWQDQGSHRLAIALGAGLGLVAVTGMTVLEGLNSGDSIMPATRFEWKENVEYWVSIALSFFAGSMLARVFVALLWKTRGRF